MIFFYYNIKNIYRGIPKKIFYLVDNSLFSNPKEDNIDDTVIAMCNLGKACGTCHANFRRLLTSQLANEVSGWSGQYVKNGQ